jgi:pathogenesis-related protein 1
MKTQGDQHKHRRLTTIATLLLAATLAGCGVTQTNRTGSAVQPALVAATQPEQRLSQHNHSNEKNNGENPVNPEAIITAHNQWRSQVGVPGLTWSDKLVNVAQDWADTLKEDGCGFYHSSNGYGENLFKASPLMWSDGQRDVQETSPEKVTNSWGNEIKDYNYSENSCSGVCGHYTQVVWKETTEVGCARSVCDDKSQIWVCSYSPAGNMAGKRPY